MFFVTFRALDFQVWRPSPTVNGSTVSGCYHLLVGYTRFACLNNGVVKVVFSSQDYTFISALVTC